MSKSFGEKRLTFTGPDVDSFALVEDKADSRAPWVKGGIPGEEAIRGFHSVALRLKDGGATEELLKFMGYEQVDKSGNIRRLAIKNGNGADVVDIESLPGAGFANLGAGSVHHVAFAVEDRARQLEVRKAQFGSEVWVNGVLVGHNDSGFTAAEYDISKEIQWSARNEVSSPGPSSELSITRRPVSGPDAGAGLTASRPATTGCQGAES